MMRFTIPLLFAVLVGCGNSFDPVSKVESIRVLATRADKPYAKPGDTVQMDMLATDARKDKSRPMALYWIPAPCVDPSSDDYYNCYSSFEGAFARGVDLAPKLVSGAKFSFQVPADAITRRPAPPGGVAYGSAIAFSMACGGHVQYVGQRGSSPQAVPFACFDANGVELGPDDFVFAYSRVFVFANRTNADPVIDGLTLNGQPVDLAVGITLDHCPTPSGNGQSSTCPTSPVDVVVPATSWELDPGDVDVNGNVAHEALWVDYYLTEGKVKDDVRTLYDAHQGKVSSADDLEAPGSIGDNTLWAVVHDNRGGVNWTQVTIHTR